MQSSIVISNDNDKVRVGDFIFDPYCSVFSPRFETYFLFFYFSQLRPNGVRALGSIISVSPIEFLNVGQGNLLQEAVTVLIKNIEGGSLKVCFAAGLHLFWLNFDISHLPRLKGPLERLSCGWQLTQQPRCTDWTGNMDGTDV